MTRTLLQTSASTTSNMGRKCSVLGRVIDVLLGLDTDRAMLRVAVAATILSSASVGRERALDDWVVGLIAAGRGADIGLSRAVGDCFRFADGERSSTQALVDAGNMLPWWSAADLKVAFFRPLAAATHWVDQRLWPTSAVAMHLHSLIWFVALLGAVALVYRRLAGSKSVTGLAFALYALDDAHGVSVGWLSNRNALIASTAGCLSLYFHDRWRRDGNATRWLAWGTFLLAWCAGEFAIGALAYLFAYAVFVDPAPRRERVLSVAPYLALTLGWRAAWSVVGYGVSGSGGYVDPLRNPFGFAEGAFSKWLSLLQGQFGVVSSDAVYLGEGHLRALWLGTAGLTVAVCAALLSRYVRDSRGRFWFMGMVLSLLPLAAAFPNDRLLLFVGLGAMPLLARLFENFLLELAGERPQGRGSMLHSTLSGGLLLVHGVLAPVLLPVRAAQLRLFAAAEARALDGWLGTREAVGGTVVILSAPSLLLANYAQARRALLGLPRPAHVYVLAATDSPVRVTRTGAADFTLTPELGYLHTHLEQHYRASLDSLPRGAQVTLSSLTAEVLSNTADGRPLSVRFALRRPVSEYLFLCWSGQGFARCDLPPLAQSIAMAHDDFGAAMARSARRSWLDDAPLYGDASFGRKP